MHANNSEFGVLKISGYAARIFLQPLTSHLLLFSIQIKSISTVFFFWSDIGVQNLQILWELIRLYMIRLYILYIRSDEGLTLETSAFQSLYGGQFTLSTPLINQIFVYHSPTDAAPQFL